MSWAQQRLLHPLQVRAHPLERDRVQRHLHEGVVVVVGHHQRRRRAAGRGRDLRLGALDVDRQRVDHQPLVLLADKRHVHAVRAQRGVLVGRRLRDAEGGEPLPVQRPGCGDGVERGRLQPELRPFVQVAAGALLQRVEELRERGVAEGVTAEVSAHALAKALDADRRHELLDDGGALAVGDAVEVEEGLVGVRHLRGDRVGGDELVLAVGPGLHPRVERLPRGVEARRLGQRQVGHEGGETLVQPEVVPPAHMVTRLPNHMCAISCSSTSARESRCVSVGGSAGRPAAPSA